MIVLGNEFAFRSRFYMFRSPKQPLTIKRYRISEEYKKEQVVMNTKIKVTFAVVACVATVAGFTACTKKRPR